jgi:hypothetical protein
MGLVTAKILVHDVLAAPMDNVTVRVYQADGVTFVAQAITGSPTPGSGEAEFSLFGDALGVNYVIRMSRVGYSFAGGATQTVSVTDPPSPDNDFGPFVATLGPPSQVVTFVVKDDVLPTPGPLENVKVRVYDAGDVFLTEGETDASGELELVLGGSVSPGTTYITRLRKDGVIFADPTQVIAVLDPLVPPATNTFDYVGHVFTPPESIDPDMCMVYGTFSTQSLDPALRLVLEFKPQPFFPDGGSSTVHGSSRLLGAFHGNPTLLRSNILTRSVKVCVDATGFFQVELPRGGCFDVHIQGFEDPIEITEQIFVPDAPSAGIIDLLYPIVASVVYDTDPINLLEGESAEVGIVVTLSNTQVVEDQELLQDLLEFSIGDGTIANVALSSGTSITVQGTLAGSTTVEVARKDDVVVPSRPPVSALVVTPPTVTVS